MKHKGAVVFTAPDFPFTERMEAMHKKDKDNKILQIIAIVLVAAVAFNGFLFVPKTDAEDFENLDINTLVTSKDNGVKIMESAGNKYLNISPAKDGISAFAEFSMEPLENASIGISYKFKINSIFQNGQTICSLSSNGMPSVIIETKNDTVCYQDSVGAYIPLGGSFVANRWYEIKVSADFSKGTFSVEIDSKKCVHNQKMIGTNKKADKVSVKAKYSPGIAIDDFLSDMTQLTGNIEINGESEIKLANGAEGDEEYEVTVYDVNGTVMENPTFNAAVLPQDSGISVTADGGKVKLTILPQTAEGDYTLRVISASSVRSFHFTLTRYTPTITRIEVEGSARIAYLGKETNYDFFATAYDEEGKNVDGAPLIYSLGGEDIPQNISINSQTGVLTVSGELPDNKKIKVLAEYSDGGNVCGEKSIMLQSQETYQGDDERFQVLLDYVDRARELGRDPYNGSYLIAKAIDRYTMKPAVWNSLTDAFVPSNLAEQGNWFRTMEALYRLTGDEQYKKEIDETYKTYAENYVYDNGTMVMGGHICVDLQTLKPHIGYNSNLELKSHFPYFDPFWEKYPELARRFVIAFWEGAVTNWKVLSFNRHISTKDAYTEKYWNDLSANNYYKPTRLGYCPVVSNGVSFRVTAADLVQMGVQLYRSTGEEPARVWPYRVLYNYFAAADPDTKLQGNQFNTRHGYKNNYNYEDLPDMWWLFPNGHVFDELKNGKAKNFELTKTKLSWFDDRFYVQFAEEFVNAGLIEEDEMDIAIEPSYRSGAGPANWMGFADLELAELYGFDSEEGKLIIDYSLTDLKSLYTYGNYSTADNSIDELLTNGTSLDGFISPRWGYYMGAGSVITRTSLGSIFTLSCIKQYRAYKELLEYQDKLYYVWQFIRGTLGYNGFGEIGVAGPDDGTKLDFSATSSDPQHLIAFCWLYEETGNSDYLDMARLIANNIIEGKMVDGMFTYQPSSHYIEIAGNNGAYPYAFALLEATIRGESELVPTYYPYDGFFDDSGYHEETGEKKSAVLDYNMWNRFNVAPVHITDIILSEEEITLKPGEEKIFSVSFEPDDATNKSVAITSSNPSVATVDSSSKCIIGIKPGTAEIQVRSTNNRLLKKIIKVTVE